MNVMCTQVAKLQRASLRDPVKVEVCNKYQTVDKLLQYYLFIPAREKVSLFILFSMILLFVMFLLPSVQLCFASVTVVNLDQETGNLGGICIFNEL